MSTKELSIIMISYNTKEILKTSIPAFEKFCKDIDYEFIVVDNNSQDGTPQFIKDDFKKIDLIENDKNLGYAKAVNKGVGKAIGEFILIVNGDAILLNSIRPIIDFMKNNQDVGLATCTIYDADMKVQFPIRRFPSFLSELYKLTIFSIKDLRSVFLGKKNNFEKQNDIIDIEWAEGCFMLTRRDILNRVGCMDERFFFYYEDVDLCYSVKKKLGARVVYYPGVETQHLGGRSTNFSDAHYLNQYYRSAIAYFKKHKVFLYVRIFSFTCLVNWLILLAGLAIINSVYQNERFKRKIEMITHVVRNNFFKKI